MVASTKPGQKARVEVWLNHAAKTEEVLGRVLSDLPADQKELLAVTDGVRVESATGPAARAGIRRSRGDRWVYIALRPYKG